MKITEFPAVQVLDPTNMFLLDGPAGTRIIYAPDLAKQLLKMGGTSAINDGLRMGDLTPMSSLDKVPDDAMFMIGTEDGNLSAGLKDAFWAMIDEQGKEDISVKRGNYRGRSLGSVVTDEQYTAIKDGSFKGLFLGDYWEIGGRKWRIMDFDYWWGTGDQACVTHHLVIMPDTILYNVQMNTSNSTAGGYSSVRNTITDNAKTIITGAFGAHVLNHRESFTTEVTNGYPTNGAFFDSTVDLANEIMVFGSYIYAPGSNGSIKPYRYTIDKAQLAAMRVNPVLTSFRQTYFLRDVATATDYVVVASTGGVAYTSANVSSGIRPVFGLVG